MRQIVLWLLAIPLFVNASSDALFSEQEDLSFYHHVNVISGHLNLCLQDIEVPGAVPYSIMRTYSTAGALERARNNSDLQLKKARHNWLIQGGWTFLPHSNLFFAEGLNEKKTTFFVAEKNGSVMKYVFSKTKHNTSIYKPEKPKENQAICLNARLNPRNNRLHYRGKRVTLFLADGGRRVYEFPPAKATKGSDYLQLIYEISADKHETHYTYDKEHHIQSIRQTSPQQKITFSSVQFKVHKEGDKNHHFHFEVNTSAHQNLHYRSVVHEQRHYIADVQSNCRPKESIEYKVARKGLGARLQSFFLAGNHQFSLQYYEPLSQKSESKYHDHPEKKPLSIDKVHWVEAPLGKEGSLVRLAEFTYFPDYTDVRDAEQILTRYHHDSHHLSQIEYFDEKDTLSSSLRLFWEGANLIGKVFVDGNGSPLFSKTFTYDAAGNVVQERFFGHLTGLSDGVFTWGERGELKGAEQYSKSYRYDPTTHLLLEETQDDGLKFLYTYKDQTSLLTSKLTLCGEKITIREFSIYNDDNLLVCAILDNGTTAEKDDLAGVTERNYKRYTLSPLTGLPLSCQEVYLENAIEKQLRRTEYVYSSCNRVIAETLYDSNDSVCYTLTTAYDDFGNVIAKSTPSGYTNIYRYSPQGELLFSQEEGSLAKEFTYNVAGQPLTETEIDREGNKRTTYSHYDPKGRPLSQTTPEGTTTVNTYDCFGKCKTTTFPHVKDPEGRAYQPTVHFSYDVAGNLTTTRSNDSKEENSHTVYNTFRKPILVTEADGSQTRHLYNGRNLLIQTIYPDQTTLSYTYDRLGRKTSEEIHSDSGALLSEEMWVYNAFHLLFYTNSEGVTTDYCYDGAGRLITEQIEERIKTYSYNALGLLETTTQGSVSQVKQYDAAGRVWQEWTEDDQSRRENLMTFAYDEKGHKIQATRLTSLGEAIDKFAYDARDRLCLHHDPLGHATEFIHKEVLNDLGQWVKQKITIDPLHNSTLETYSALGHLISEEKQNSQQATVSKQFYIYDLFGNRSKRLVIIYEGTTSLREHVTEWSYDSQNRLIQEREAPDKVYSYTYNLNGQMECKTLPSGITLHHLYDGLGRLIEQYSSDRTIHYRYHYEKGPNPLQIDDLIQGLTLYRSYNHFKELIYERNPLGLETQWEYDTQGHCTRLTLPDHSSISYVYEGAHLTAVQRASPQGNVLYQHLYTAFDPNGHIAQETLIGTLGQLATQRDLLERPLTQTSAYLNHTTSYGPSGLVMTQTNTLLGDKTFRYDPLHQLIEETGTSYAFDSLGNPSGCQVNPYNQIIATPNATLEYDPEGNPKTRTSSGEITSYTYDALGRLTSISSSDQTVTYRYDPLSRLLKKESTNAPATLYLYDDTQEIGTCNEEMKIQELKVLGVGIRGDIGATVAIELKGDTFAPLHDFSGHIIALIAPDGTSFETYSLNAFGQEPPTLHPVNPWRFSSKRHDNGLIFFGKRFYDPVLGRFLTPDPAGFADGPNLYVYVLNNPLNRLDLFGLTSEPLEQMIPRREFAFNDPLAIDVPISVLTSQAQGRAMMKCSKPSFGFTEHYVIICDNVNRIKFSPEEKQAGYITLKNHFQELVPSKGSSVGLITFQNGINVNYKDFVNNCTTLMDKVPEGPLFIGKYTPTNGLFFDLVSTGAEKLHIETPMIAATRQFLVHTAKTIHQINPNLVWVHVSHSRASQILHYSCKGMTPDEQTLVRQQLYSAAFAPARPLSNKYAFKAVNIYSKNDYVTKGFSNRFLNNPHYDIQFATCETSILNRILFFADHGIAEATYQNSMNELFNNIRRLYPIYDPKL